MRVLDDLGTFEDVAAGAPAHAESMRAVRALVAELHPEAYEKASAREGSVWWGHGPRKMIEGYAYVMPHAAHLNLGFFRGTSLPDPEDRLRGTGKALRHLRLTRPEDAADGAVRRLLIAAISERRPT